MNGKLLMLTLVLGLASALPTKNNKNSPANNRLGFSDGNTTTINNVNYLVSLVVNDKFYCVGTIIADSLLLVLGDCAFAMSESDFTVVAGSNDGLTGTKFSVVNIIRHPNITLDGTYDFAIFQINDTFTFGEDIGQVTLPSAECENWANLVVTGYGTSDNGPESMGNLSIGNMQYVSRESCQSISSDSYYSFFDKTQACAYNKGKVTMCEHDLGNPLTKDRVLYGLMMTAKSKYFCTALQGPTIIADVYSVVDWISETIASGSIIVA